MRKPPKGCVWIHVDRLDREDGKVWAVQSWVNGKCRYELARSVVILAESYTQFFGPKGKQPKAVIVVALRASVNIDDTTGIAVIGFKSS